MSKKSRKRNKILLAGAALLGASKLGMLGGKTAGINVDKGRGSALGEKYRSTAKKFTKPVGPKKVNTSIVPKKRPGITVDKDLPNTGPFKFFGAGNKGANFSKESVDAFKKSNEAQKARRSKSFFGINLDSLKSKMAGASESRAAKKIAFNEKIKANNAKIKNPGSYFNKGTMVKARGGGMARSKPTKLY
jgi:hypothetical protein